MHPRPDTRPGLSSVPGPACRRPTNPEETSMSKPRQTKTDKVRAMLSQSEGREPRRDLQGDRLAAALGAGGSERPAGRRATRSNGRSRRAARPALLSTGSRRRPRRPDDRGRRSRDHGPGRASRGLVEHLRRACPEGDQPDLPAALPRLRDPGATRGRAFQADNRRAQAVRAGRPSPRRCPRPSSRAGAFCENGMASPMSST